MTAAAAKAIALEGRTAAQGTELAKTLSLITESAREGHANTEITLPLHVVGYVEARLLELGYKTGGWIEGSRYFCLTISWKE